MLVRYQLVEKQLIEFSAVAMQRQDFKKTDDMFNRVLGKDHIAVICLFEDKQTKTRIIIANAHIHWDPAYCDVKLVQVALLLDEIEKIASGFAKYPPPPTAATLPAQASAPDDADSNGASAGDPPTSPSNTLVSARPPPTYSDGTKIPLIVCGDFNSVPSSSLYEFMSTGSLPANHPDFLSHTYGRYTAEGLRHRLGLKNSYAAPGVGEFPLTNYTPSYQGVIDYVWYSGANLSPNGVLGEVDQGYLEKVVGFPNAHFPSEYVFLDIRGV
jgi:CCR4-NOT transcription complex subunit 6